MKLPRKTLERQLFTDYNYVVGVDEVGMGCLAGPVVVCAAAFSLDFFKKKHPELHRLRDSKLLSAEQRERFAQGLLKLKGGGLAYTLTTSPVVTIDKINVYQAARLAMVKAVKRLRLKGGAIVLVDGPAKIKNLAMDQQAIVGGDRKIFAIACASILAKVYRDKLMVNYAKKFPGYGFEKHKGYGTKLHRECLVALGLCSLHRRSFAPVASLR